MFKKLSRGTLVIACSLMMVVCAMPSSVFALDPPYTMDDYQIVYNTEKATLTGMPVVDDAGQPINKEITFSFWNATLQQFEATVVSSNGVLPDVELIKGDHYIVYAEDSEYNFKNNAYLILNETGHVVVDDRAKAAGTTMDKFVLYKAATPVAEPEKSKRVDVKLSAWHWDPEYYGPNDGDFDDDDYDWNGAQLVFTSPFETVKAPIKERGYVEVSLLEDATYVVSIESDTLTTYSFPLTVKDHSEQGRPKATYNHLSCATKAEVYCFDKGAKMGDYKTVLTSTSGKTTVEGWNFDPKKFPWPAEKKDSVRYALDERDLGKTSVSGITGDYTVLAINTINMARIERSRLQLPTGSSFVITTAVDIAKEVGNLFFIDGDGNKINIGFEQTGDKLKFEHDTLTIDKLIIQYKTAKDADVNYQIIEGDGAKWTADSADTLTLKYVDTVGTDTSYEDFTEVTVDGAMLTQGSDYNVEKGSLKLTFTNDYLKTLAVGDYSVVAKFNGGANTVRSTFSVVKGAGGGQNPGGQNPGGGSSVAVVPPAQGGSAAVAAADPAAASAQSVVKTGDTSAPYVYGAVLIISAVVLIYVVVRKKASSNEK